MKWSLRVRAFDPSLHFGQHSSAMSVRYIPVTIRSAGRLSHREALGTVAARTLGARDIVEVPGLAERAGFSPDPRKLTGAIFGRILGYGAQSGAVTAPSTPTWAVE